VGEIQQQVQQPIVDVADIRLADEVEDNKELEMLLAEQPTLPASPPAAAQVGESQQQEVIQQPTVDNQPATQVADNRQVEMQAEQPTIPASPAAAVQVEEIQHQEAIQVQQPTDAVVDKQPRYEDVAKATLDGVSEAHVASAGSDTDEAPELITDSLSHDHDATDEHDHPHPSVCHHYSIIDLTVNTVK